MKRDDKLYKGFLAELRALEDFRLAYAAEHPTAGLAREDPDVRRLTEATAFFAARARRAAKKSAVAMRERLFRQLVPYLLSPLPAMGLLRAAPSARWSEVSSLPRHSEIALSVPDGTTALFRTLSDVSLLPLRLDRVQTLQRADGGLRFLLPFRTPYPRTDEIGRLRLYVDYANDFMASLSVIEALRESLVQASVSFDERVDEETRGQRCQVTFGTDDADLQSIWPHPIERERAAFHFPATALFVSFDIPRPSRNWEGFTLCLDVRPGWPKKLRLTTEAFELFVTPIVNQHRTMAQPIPCDGTQERWPIFHPDPTARFSVQSVLGVHQVLDGALVPLRLGALTGAAESYELEEREDERGGTSHSVLLRIPEAFETPRTVGIDAFWFQPWFSERLGENLEARPYRRAYPGMDWEMVGPVTPHRPNDFGDSMDDFLQVLVLQNKERLDRDEIDTLLVCMGSAWSGRFAALRSRLRGVEVRDIPDERSGGGAGRSLLYVVRVSGEDAAIAPLIPSFRESLQRLLDAWIAETPVEVRVEVVQ